MTRVPVRASHVVIGESSKELAKPKFVDFSHFG